MVSGTRSGWTAANGHINQPNLANTPADQDTFYQTEFINLNPSAQIGLKDFKRPDRLVRWANMGDASARRSERAFFKVNQLEIFVHTNYPDIEEVEFAIGGPPPPLFFNGMEDFSRKLQSRTTQRFTPSSCNRTYNFERTLLRNAKTAGVLAFNSKIEREQRWLETRGPIFREVMFRGKYHSGQ